MTYFDDANRKPKDTSPIAIIDIGSNSIRLVVYEGGKPFPSPLYNEKVLCGLGRSLISSGKLSQESMTLALNALRRFISLVVHAGARKLHAVATAAVREAKNGADFIQQAENVCGAEVSILTGKEEAKYAALGVIFGFRNSDGIAGDLGGGSLELMDISQQAVVNTTTLPLGGLRLIDVSKGDLKRAENYIDEQLTKVVWLKAGKGRPFYAIGGTWRAFAKLHMAQMKYPLRITHDYRISRDEALKFAFLMNNNSPSSLDGINRISKARRETVPFGALVLARLLRIVEISELVISAYGVREGLLFSLLSKKDQEADPLLSACRDIASIYARSAVHAEELCDWTDGIFCNLGPKESVDEKRLRYAACLVSDIGWRAHPEYRGEYAVSAVAKGSFSCVDHPGRAFIASTVYFRYGRPAKLEPFPQLSSLADEVAIARARIIGAAIRAAHALSAGMPGLLCQTSLTYKSDKMVLNLPAAHYVLESERLKRRLRSLAKLLHCEFEIRTLKPSKPEELLRV